MINLYAIHRNKQIWSDPEAFRPERFLNENNGLRNLDKIIPFGYGELLDNAMYLVTKDFPKKRC